MRRRRSAPLSIPVGLTAFLLCACATTDGSPFVDLTPYTLSDLTIPESLPGPDDSLGFLRPDADPVRDDVDIVVKPYAVQGSTPESLLRGEDGILPSAREAGLEFIARVDWRVRWAYDFATEDELCRADDVTTALTVTYQLPEWKPDEAPEALIAYWDDFEHKLWLHEYGHALIGYRAQQDIETALEVADISDPDCDIVGDGLNSLAHAIIARGLDAKYDARTGHGKTQGATFNVSDAEAAIRAAEKES